MCGGYINHTVYDRIDYPTVTGTLYENQKLIDLLNMQAGDDKIVGQRIYAWDNPWKGIGPNLNTIPIKKVMKKYFKDVDGIEPGTYYNYSAMTTNVIMNYVIYKTGDDWNKLLHKVFNEHVIIKKNVYFLQTANPPYNETDTSGRYSFYADRYDYLRIAKTMLDDWNNDTCVGKYLKTVYERRINKGSKDFKPKYVAKYSKKYGGQFHFNIVGLEKRAILGMDGYGGQQILIDFDKQRVIV